MTTGNPPVRSGSRYAAQIMPMKEQLLLLMLALRIFVIRTSIAFSVLNDFLFSAI